MTALAKSRTASDFSRPRYKLNEAVRLKIPGGSKGRRAAGPLSLAKIREMAE